MIDKELLEQFQLMTNGMTQMESRLSQKIQSEVREAETRISVKIENEVSDRIKSLFDGYKSALENQVLLELANKTLVKRLDEMETRLAVLENKIA